GIFEMTVPRVGAGARYQYRLDGERHRPDPTSRWQPDGVHGPSAVVDPTAFAWTDAGFRGHALADLVFYELHVGAFTPARSFDGADAAGVRRHFVENARAWVREFHVDGLRLDAIPSIFDTSPVHILTEVADAAREEARRLGRSIHIIAESHDNDRRIVLPSADGGLGLDAVWSDDFHHAVHVALTGERGGYYADFTDPALLPRAVAEGFAFQGQSSEYFGGPRGTPSADLPGEHFVIFVQNHDQVGNRAQSDR